MSVTLTTGQQPIEARCPVLVLNPIEELTEIELETLQLTAYGFTAKEIAGREYLATVTINKRLEIIRDKLGAKNKAHAVAIALTRKLIKFDTVMA